MTFTPTLLGTGVAGYAFLARTREDQQARLEQSTVVQRDLTAFKERIEGVDTADGLLEDRALLRVALGAFGLSEDINNTAFLKKALESDLTDDDSFANRLADKRYLALAQAFDFANPDGPGLGDLESSDSIKARLSDIATPQELLDDTRLLRATLQELGLERDLGNTYFLEQVLSSDVTDPNSFANRLSNPQYAELASAFDFAGKAADQNSMFTFAATYAEDIKAVETTEDLMANEDLLTATLTLFGLQSDLDRPTFLTSVFDSDLTDPLSVANQEDDPRYAALSDAFGFGSLTPLAEGEQTKIADFVDLLAEQEEPPATPQEFMVDFRLLLATMDFFGVPPGLDTTNRLGNFLTGSPDDPLSARSYVTDPRYLIVNNALSFTPQPEGRVFPPGFAENIAQTYIERQFEVRVGEQNSDMRIALSLKQDLQDVLETGTSNDSRWFAVLASPPLRTAFETAFNLPSAFSALDIDRQLEDLKDRSEQFMGTRELADLISEDNLAELRERFLVRQQAASFGAGTNIGTSTASIILAQLT